MDPVVYDFRINENGTIAHLKTGENALFPVKYYTLILPRLLKKILENFHNAEKVNLKHFQNPWGSYANFIIVV